MVSWLGFMGQGSRVGGKTFIVHHPLQAAKNLPDPGRAAVAHKIVDQPGMVAADQNMVIGQGIMQKIARRFPQLQANLGAA